MKIIFLCAAFILCLSSYGQIDLSDNLCAKNEEVIMSFKTLNRSKVISICKEKTGRYLVYRFGTKDKIELQYPKKLDKTSWTLFHI